MTGLINEKWVEYQVEATRKIQKMIIRYQGMVGSTMTIQVDGKEAAQSELPWNESQWAEQEVPLSMDKGKHTVRLLSGGNITFNWIHFL